LVLPEQSHAALLGYSPEQDRLVLQSLDAVPAGMWQPVMPQLFSQLASPQVQAVPSCIKSRTAL
jgi:hypothetical protein